MHQGLYWSKIRLALLWVMIMNDWTGGPGPRSTLLLRDTFNNTGPLKMDPSRRGGIFDQWEEATARVYPTSCFMSRDQKPRIALPVWGCCKRWGHSMARSILILWVCHVEQRFGSRTITCGTGFVIVAVVCERQRTRTGSEHCWQCSRKYSEICYRQSSSPVLLGLDVYLQQ